MIHWTTYYNSIQTLPLVLVLVFFVNEALVLW